MVKRWSIKEEGLHNDTNGKWVTYEDYSALQSLNAEMLEIVDDAMGLLVNRHEADSEWEQEYNELYTKYEDLIRRAEEVNNG